MNTKEISFSDKRLLVLINGNKYSYGKHELYSEREKAIRFFEKDIPEEFDLYGTNRDKRNIKQVLHSSEPFLSYKGQFKNKFDTLAKYKFNICFENMCHVNGYITEKIRDSFKAKSVPIYWGAENIIDYIPKNCFIDMRDFTSYQELLVYIKSIDQDQYAQYIYNINTFMKTDDAQKRFGKIRAENFIEQLQ